MDFVALKPGIVRIRPLPSEEVSQIIKVVQDHDTKIFFRGIVVSLGTLTLCDCGFDAGDTVVYTDPISITAEDDLVSMVNVFTVEQQAK
jgi:hypothetical protein